MHAAQGDWLPVRAALHPTGLFLAMRDIAPDDLQDAFMQETIVRVAASERVVQVPRELCAFEGTGEDATPAGIIYHVARAGSTVVSQLLKHQGASVVYSEPLPFNELLLPPHRWPRVELVTALRALGHTFARHARGPYVLKLTSWNAYYCDLLAEAFPAAPWIACLRDPVEVAVSLQGRLSGWLRGSDESSRRLLQIVDPAGEARTPEQLVARAYGAICDSLCRLDPARGLLVPYETLPAAVWERVAPHFSLVVDPDAQRRMAGAALRTAKAPIGQPAEFVSDSAAKQAAASAALRDAVVAHARPALDRLLDTQGFRQ